MRFVLIDVAADVLLSVIRLLVVGCSAASVMARCCASDRVTAALLTYTPPWSDVRLPAELKHITKRRRRKQP